MGGLLSAIDDAKSGRGLLVMLASEPGIGKTRIVQKFGAIAEKRDAQMLWGRCYEGEGVPHYRPPGPARTGLHLRQNL